MNAHGVNVDPEFATSFQAAASTLTPAGAGEAMAKRIKVPNGSKAKNAEAQEHVDMPLAAMGFVQAPKPAPALSIKKLADEREPDTVKVTELERQVLHAAWSSQYHDGRFPVGDGQWAEVEHLGKSAQGAVASCVKKGWLVVQGSGKKGDEVVHTITAEGAAAIGMPSTREEWERSKTASAQTASPEPGAGATQQACEPGGRARP